MKILYIDLETTGLNPRDDQILEIGMVVDDLSRPPNDKDVFSVRIKHERIYGDAYALAMNHEILRDIATGKTDTPILAERHVHQHVVAFLEKHFVRGVPITVGGKNVAGFDLLFLRRLEGFAYLGSEIQLGATPDLKPFTFRRRCIDPAILFWNPKTDSELPNLDKCLERAGLLKRTQHQAVDDCFLVRDLVRSKMTDIGN